MHTKKDKTTRKNGNMATDATLSHQSDNGKSSTVDFQLVFESSPHPYVILEPDSPKFTIVAVNDSYLAATRTEREAMLGRSMFEVFPDNPNDSSATGSSDLRISLERVIQERVQDVMGVQKYDIPRRGEGETGFEVKYWSPVNTPIFGEDGSLIYIAHRAEDVTEFILMREQTAQETQKVQAKADRIEAEVLQRAREVKEANRELKAAKEELARLNERLQELDRAKTVFFSNISHEFRTPLTLMLGPMEDMLHDPQSLPHNRQRIEVAHRNALRLQKLVNTLLDFSRIEAGRIHASYQPTDLSAYTAELASMFRSAIEKAGLELIVECPSLDEPVYVDRDMWEKIVLNLLSNAFKHTFEGKIKVRLQGTGDHAEMIVQDTGIGVPPEQLPHLFERFHRVPNARSRTHEGSGIGLALVCELVKLHGGSIDVDSTVDQGTTFTVSIPTGKNHLPSDQIEAPSPLASTAVGAQPFVEEALRWLPGEEESSKSITPSTSSEAQMTWAGVAHPGRARIIIADDNQDMRDYVRRLLEPYCEVEAVPDGSAALLAAHQQAPDLILSDVMMPKMDGFELLKAVRGEPSLKMIPLILLSARAGEEARIEGIEAGADDYLIKPFNARELLASVKASLDLYRTRMQESIEALRENERQFRTLANSVAQLAWMANPDGWIYWYNERWYEYTGTTLKEMQGWGWEKVHHPDHIDRVVTFVKEAWGRGEPWELTFPLRSVQGEYRWFLTRAYPVKDSEGKVMRWIGTNTDINEQIETEQELRELKEQLEQRVSERTAQLEAVNKELEAFSYSVSHDLRAPLRTIDGFSQAVMETAKDKLDEREKDYLNRVRVGSQQMSTLINDMLNLSRLTRAEMTIDEHVNLSAIAQKIADELKRQEPERQVEFEIEENVIAKGDKHLLEAVLQNLLDNSWKYTSKHPTAWIKFGKIQDGRTIYYVKDDGAGFNMKYASKLFGAFQRLHRVDQFEGTGVGLATVARIIHRHGGEVWGEGEVEKGATFYFTLEPEKLNKEKIYGA